MFDVLLRCAGVREKMLLGSRVGMLALHGGLEPGTEGMALAAARRSGASAYVVTQPRTLGWHLSSHRIDPRRAPALAAFLDHIDVTVSVHGYFRPEQPDACFVGGGNRELARDLGARLREVVDEMPIVDDLDAIPRAMRGVDPRNPVNRSRHGGVQLELPHRARDYRGPGCVSERVAGVLADFARDVAA